MGFALFGGFSAPHCRWGPEYGTMLPLPASGACFRQGKSMRFLSSTVICLAMSAFLSLVSRHPATARAGVGMPLAHRMPDNPFSRK